MRALTELIRRWIKPASPSISEMFTPEKHYVGHARSDARFTTSEDGTLYYVHRGNIAVPFEHPENNIIASMLMATYNNYHCPTIRWQ